MLRIMLTFLVALTLLECQKKKDEESGIGAVDPLANGDTADEHDSATIAANSEYSETLSVGAGEIVIPGGAFDRKTKATLTQIGDVRDVFGFSDDVIILGDPVEIDLDHTPQVPIQVTLYIDGKKSADEVSVVVKDAGGAVTILATTSIFVEYSKGVTSVTFTISSAFVSLALVTAASAGNIEGATNGIVVGNPNDYIVVANSATSLTLSWTIPAAAVGGITYVIAYKTGATAPKTCGAGTVIPSSEINSGTSWEITGLAPATQLALRLCSQSSDGTSTGVTAIGTTGNASGGSGDGSGGDATATPTITPTATPTLAVSSQTRKCGDATATNNNLIGSISWTDLTVSNFVDGNTATISIQNLGAESNGLLHTGFGFSLPAETTAILGVVIQISRSEANAISAGHVRDKRVLLYVNSDLFGSQNKAVTSTDWGTSIETITYGSETALWGYSSLTKSEVEASNFGFAISVENSLDTSFAAEGAVIEYCDMTIYYR